MTFASWRKCSLPACQARLLLPHFSSTKTVFALQAWNARLVCSLTWKGTSDENHLLMIQFHPDSPLLTEEVPHEYLLDFQCPCSDSKAWAIPVISWFLLNVVSWVTFNLDCILQIVIGLSTSWEPVKNYKVKTRQVIPGNCRDRKSPGSHPFRIMYSYFLRMSYMRTIFTSCKYFL